MLTWNAECGVPYNILSIFVLVLTGGETPSHNYSCVRKQTDRTAESERACERERECGQADVSLCPYTTAP